MNDLNKKYLDEKFINIDPLDFYKELFGDNLDIYGEMNKGEYTGIAIEILDNNIKRYSITDGLFELKGLIDNSNGFCFMSPISYCGKSRKKENARFLFAMAIDLDGLKIENNQPVGLMALLKQISTGEQPTPTYIVHSGNNIHLYYFFDKPIPLYKENISELEYIRKNLIKQLWNDAITTLSNKNDIQWENLFQGFRIVGTDTKSKNGTKCVAYKFGNGDRLSIDELTKSIRFIDNKKTSVKSKPKYSLIELKTKFPEWYERHFDEDGKSLHNNKRNYWVCNKALYYWWKNRIINEIYEGHRYYSLLCLCAYALKCGISYEELEKDCYEILPIFDKRTLNINNKFTEYDVKCALSAYNIEDLKGMSIFSISRYSGLDIEKNKRNGRKREEHIKRITLLRDNDYPDGSWRNPKKENIVKEWKNKNPDGNKSQCARELKISRTTVIKWWD